MDTSKFSDNMAQAMTLLIEKVSAGIDAASTFLAAQIPDVLRQLLLYNFVINLLICLLGLGIVVSTPFVLKYVFSKTKESYPHRHLYHFDQLNYGWLIFLLGGIPLTTLGLILFFTHFDWIKIWLAPKIYLIQYGVELVRQVSGK